ncbi:vanadium-dependent haloperoxidase [Arthrospiribacter ruber]|nr:vanadium-dependent haloperoxidase [Arthrospiribacter ruber]
MPLASQTKGIPPTQLYIDNLFKITEVMVTDVASPPAAARFYAYTTLAAHLAWELAENKHLDNSLANHINSKPEINFEIPENIDPYFCAVFAMLEVGSQIMPSGASLSQAKSELEKDYVKSKKLKKQHLEHNKKFALQVATTVMVKAKNDNYAQLSTLTRYSPKKGEGYWYPTPPAYMAAVEPEWRTITPFFLDELSNFKPTPPAVFSLDEESSFHRQMTEVYEVTSQLSNEQKLIANFWDCNPFMVQYSGHMAIGIKKISPGGHWIGITGIAAQQANLDWNETLYIHALVAAGLHDAFISCWEEKYDSDRIRPESAITKYLDNNWRPLLQTPPFPEYTSGHSVVSTLSSVILTDFFGENFEFIDTSEVYFGLPERAFGSFEEAAAEAAISRLYGGIHFRDAIEEGVVQGRKIGKMILEKVKGHEALVQH